MFQTTLKLMIAVAVGLLGNAATAHQGDKHSAPAGPVKKEQKEWGIAGDAKAVKRTVEYTMTDNMRFTPDKLEVRLGETIKIVVKNDGKMLHEFVLGTKKELDAHAALMVKFPNMEHDEPYMAHVPVGKTAQIIWTFNRAGEFDFACLIAGHYQAGMVGKVRVAATSAQAPSVPLALLTTVADAPTAKGGAAAADMTDGEVRKIDLDSGKVTLRHAEIKSLDMPGMTMVFVVKDKAMHDKLKAGDKVRFKAVNDAGKFTVTEILPAH